MADDAGIGASDQGAEHETSDGLSPGERAELERLRRVYELLATKEDVARLEAKLDAIAARSGLVSLGNRGHKGVGSPGVVREVCDRCFLAGPYAVKAPLSAAPGICADCGFERVLRKARRQ